MSEVTYTNNNTQNTFTEEKIVADTENGLIITTTTSWKLVPHDQITKETSYRNYYDKEAPAFRNTDTNPNPYLAHSDSQHTTYTEKLERRFGFRNLCIATKKTAPISGILSLPIDVTETSYITVDGDIRGTENGSVEISIVDNTDEIPITTGSSKEIIKEKLFFEQPTRFLIDQECPITLYENNILSKKNYAMLTAQEFQDNEYALSYTASGDAGRYFPVSPTIQVKILIRQYVDEPPFASISHIVVHKHGETLQWNSKV